MNQLRDGDHIVIPQPISSTRRKREGCSFINGLRYLPAASLRELLPSVPVEILVR